MIARVAICSLVLCCHAFATIIDSTRLVDWSNNVGVLGGIPSPTVTNTTLTTANTLAQINSAIANCPSNQVVLLSDGTYTLNGSIALSKSGVVLRGQSTNTILKFTGNSLYGNVSIEGSSFDDPCCETVPNVVNWTAGYEQGETNITLSSVSGLSVGTMLQLDQLNDDVLVSSTASENVNYLGRGSGARLQLQSVRVIAINGNVVSIFPGLYMPNWASGQSPQAWWFNGSPVEMAGIENLTITNVSGSDHQVAFFNARNCWAKDIASYNAGGEHIRTYMASRIEVAHSYFYGTVSAGSQSYGLNPYYAWDFLGYDNIMQKVTTPVLLEQASGCVIAYNYATNLYYTVYEEWLIEGASTHGAHCSFNLFEGNHIPNIYLDYIHGSGSHNTVLRNRAEGWETGKSVNTYALAIERFNYYNNVVGNLFGKYGFHEDYQVEVPPQAEQAVYRVGYYDASGSTANFDTNVQWTLIRHMNYDVTTTTNAGIVYDDSIEDYDVPDSYYLLSKPSWFGVLDWPPFDPGSTNDADMSYTNLPAGYRFINGDDPPAATQSGRTARIKILRVGIPQ